MITFGFEREYFITNPHGEPMLCPPSTPTDGGILAEARGAPSFDPVLAAFSLLAEEHKIRTLLPPKLTLSIIPVMKVSRDLQIEASRQHTKGLTHYQNLYGYTKHRNRRSEMTAGVHVSVARMRTITISNNYCDKCQRSTKTTEEIGQTFDYPALIRGLDERFATEIKEAKRHKGFYEIKSNGRVEYRSLPNSIDLLTVAEWLSDNISSIHGSWS